MQGFKYGLLVLPSREGLSAPLRMDDSTELVPTTLDALIDKKQTKHWREWVGSIEWKQLTEADALVITRIPSDTPEVMDGESQKLQGRAVTSWFAYLLAEPHPFTRGRGWILSGPCENGNRGGRLLDVKVFSREELTSPFYSELNEFWDSRGDRPQALKARTDPRRTGPGGSQMLKRSPRHGSRRQPLRVPAADHTGPGGSSAYGSWRQLTRVLAADHTGLGGRAAARFVSDQAEFSAGSVA